MNFTARDFRTLQWPLLGTVLMLILTAGLVIWSSKQLDGIRSQRDAAERSKQAAEQRLRQVRHEEQELRDRGRQYQHMLQQGMIGDEKRLEWTELIEEIRQQMRIPAINYEFGVRKPLDGGQPGQSHFASAMRLQMRLLHEKDLLDFLRRLQQEAKAQVIVRSCSVSPLAARPVGNSELARLGAECELRWITVRPPASQP